MKIKTNSKIKIYLALVLLVSLTAITVTQGIAQLVTVQKPLQCGDTKTVFESLADGEYKEKPIWWGIDSATPVSRYSLFVNEKTKTWTLIQFDEKVACVLGVGESSTRIFNGPAI
jgi:hypothetical protein